MGRKLTHEEFIAKLYERNLYYAQYKFVVVGRYKNSKSAIQCYCNVHNVTFESPPDQLYYSCGCRQCGIDARIQSKRMLHEEFIKRVSDIDSDITVVDRYVDCDTPINFQCAIGHVWKSSPDSVLHGHTGCPYCNGSKILAGFNDLWTTHPDIACLLKYKEDGYKYSKGSGKRVDFVCPNCGYESKKEIKVVCRSRLSCPKCGDGISYPNKFGRALLDQLPIEDYQCEYQPKWAKPYFYDNYFQYNDAKYILEMDGGFHYEDNRILHKSVQEQLAIDSLKTQLAMQHNIMVIRINCLHSNKEYIANNVCQSVLGNIFDLSSIDWDVCDKKAQKSLVKDACELYMSNAYNIKTLAAMLHVHRSTVSRYLKIGVKFGWCNYNPNNQTQKTSCGRITPVVLLDLNDNVIRDFQSIQQCIQWVRDKLNVELHGGNISIACTQNKPYKGFKFRHIKNNTKLNVSIIEARIQG